jgi:hypothetical protein
MIDNDPVTLEKTSNFYKQAGFNKDLTFSDRGFEQLRKFLGDAAKRKGCAW